MKTYLATAKGYDGQRIIAEGQLFTTDIPKGCWMVEVDKDGKPIPEEDETPAPKPAAKAKTEA